MDSARAVQEARVVELRAMAEEREKGELERAMALRYRRVKFFGRGRVWDGCEGQRTVIG